MSSKKADDDYMDIFVHNSNYW